MQRHVASLLSKTLLRERTGQKVKHTSTRATSTVSAFVCVYLCLCVYLSGSLKKKATNT